MVVNMLFLFILLYFSLFLSYIFLSINIRAYIFYRLI